MFHLYYTVQSKKTFKCLCLALLLLLTSAAQGKEAFCFKPLDNPNWVCGGTVYVDK